MFLNFFISKKFLLSSSLGAVPTSIVFVTSGSKFDYLYSFEGSSSMKSAIEFLISKYQNTDATVGANVQAVGSNVGLEKVLSGLSDFALVSHDISELAKGKYENQWKDKKIKTITLAKEAILLLYKPPENCDKSLDISKDTVKEIYELFLGKVAKSEAVNGWSCGNPITVWVKSGGPTRSGTAKAFIDNPLLKLSEIKEETKKSVSTTETNQENKNNLITELERANYDGIERIRQTSESGTLSWSSFKSNIVDGSLIYLPSSFVFTNWSEIKALGLKIASFKGNTNSNEISSLSTQIDLDKYNFKEKIQDNSYSWGRSLNLVYSTAEMTEKKKSLIKWIANNTHYLSSVNLVPFKYRVKDSMSSIHDTSIKEIDIEQSDVDSKSYGLSSFSVENGGI